jgi:hypothetical protein
MIPAGRIRWLRTWVPLLLLAFLSLSCGTGGIDFAGGGTGGTGISTGAVAGFGSVVMNGVEFHTDNQVAPGFQTKKISKGMVNRTTEKDRDVFRVGMVVTVRHSSDDNNAVEIDYEPNLVGTVAAKDPGIDLSIQVLGHTVLLDNGALFDNLVQGNVVEVSGFADNSGRIRAMYLETLHPAPNTFTIKGFISDHRPADHTFAIGPLPHGSGITATVSYTTAAVRDLPSGVPANDMYVRVETRDTQPGSGGIRADYVSTFVPRTEFPEGATVDLEGLVTSPPIGSGKVLSFAVEGKLIRTDDATDFTGHSPAEIQPNTRLLVQGRENGGVLSAVNIIFR